MSEKWRFCAVAKDMESATTMTPAPCHHDTSSNLSPEKLTADRKSLILYTDKLCIIFLSLTWRND